MDKLDGLTMDLESSSRDKLHTVFPECFTEGRLDIDKLLSLCGEYITDDFEKYEFKWKGKSDCLRLAQKRSTATLRPVPGDSVNWGTTQNLYIEGDNLEVLKPLQKSYFRKVKMIYIDLPYNTGNDFVYEDDFTDPLARYKEVTAQTTKSNPETMGRYHTNWLNMMYPRLRLAANLLRDDGVIFISIDDVEVQNLRRLCDEVFGEENFVAQIIWHSRQNKDNRNISGMSIDHEYILYYTKQFGQRVFRGTERKSEQYTNPDNDPRGSWTSANMVGLATADTRPNLHYDLINPVDGTNYGCPAKGWRYDRNSMKRLIEENRILWPDNPDGRPRRKAFLNELSDNLPGFSSLIQSGIYTNTATKEVTSLFEGKHYFDFPKPISLIEQLLSQVTENGDIVLDFFSGSATTAHAVMQLNAEDGGNRRFIMVQLPEVCDEKSEAARNGYPNICEIGKERIRRAGKKLTEAGKDIDTGFKVFRLDSSNLKLWDDTPIESGDLDSLFARMNGMIDNLKPGRSEDGLVYEILLKMGYPLTADVAALELDGLTVYTVEQNSMLICLQPGVTAETVEKLAALKPQKIVLTENALADNSAMSNVHYLLENRGIELKIV
jgi:adenine-specific DNA-methyltransferase